MEFKGRSREESINQVGIDDYSNAISEYLETLRFEKVRIGGVKEEDVLLKIKELCHLYDEEVEELKRQYVYKQSELENLRLSQGQVYEAIAQAKTNAVSILAKASGQSDNIIQDAKLKAAQIIQEAKTESAPGNGFLHPMNIENSFGESEQIIASANAQAAQIIRQASAQAESIRLKAEEEREKIISELEERKRMVYTFLEEERRTGAPENSYNRGNMVKYEPYHGREEKKNVFDNNSKRNALFSSGSINLYNNHKYDYRDNYSITRVDDKKQDTLSDTHSKEDTYGNIMKVNAVRIRDNKAESYDEVDHLKQRIKKLQEENRVLKAEKSIKKNFSEYETKKDDIMNRPILSIGTDRDISSYDSENRIRINR